MKIEQGKRHWYVILETGKMKFPSEQDAKDWVEGQGPAPLPLDLFAQEENSLNEED